MKKYELTQYELVKVRVVHKPSSTGKGMKKLFKKLTLFPDPDHGSIYLSRYSRFIEF